jgi:hypothetical protein
MQQHWDQRDHADDVHPTIDRMADGYARDNLDSPMTFALWVVGLLGVGAAAFVLSALVSLRGLPA